MEVRLIDYKTHTPIVTPGKRRDDFHRFYMERTKNNFWNI